MSLALAYGAGIATACALRWLRWRHLVAAWWMLRAAPMILAGIADHL